MSDRMKKTRQVLLDIGAAVLVVVVLYILIVYLVLPFYTRHWQSISVPNVEGISQRAAEKILEYNKLQSVVDIEKFDNNLPPGFVIFQNPEPNRSVKKKRRIYLVISKGYMKINMPDLIGVPMRDARFTVEKEQIVMGDIEYEFHRYYPENVIIEQSIPPNTEIVVNTKVDLIVSLGNEPENITVPNLTGRHRQEALLKIQKAGLTLGSVNVRETTVFPDETVIGQSMKAGHSAEKGDTLNIILTENPTKEEKPW